MALRHSVFFSAHAITSVRVALCMGLLMSPLQAALPATFNPIDMSLEDLLNIEVISVSRKIQPLSETTAAVFVITADDIRRSGVTSIPEALRMAPGVEVARIDNNKWAITARGFNGRFANKLLVLMDGRTLYTPLFSGVFWDVQDTLLEDIERIEVIRGPGATMWGANAVNGVINIITRASKDTQGTLVSNIIGSEEKHIVGVRHGAITEQGTAWRIYAKSADHAAAVEESGSKANDDWRTQRIGFRADTRLSEQNSVTVQADAYWGTNGEKQSVVDLQNPPSYYRTQVSDATTQGFNVLGRGVHKLDNGDELMLHSYVDRMQFNGANAHVITDTLNLDIQHRLQQSETHDVMLGAGYRLTSDRWFSGYTQFRDTRYTAQLYSAFVQDDIRLSENVSLILGSKFEHNEYTAWEVQPSSRLLWRLDSNHALWTAISRATRSPSRGETNSNTDLIASSSGISGVPFVVRAVGNDMDAERLTAYEAGWRFKIGPSFSVDITGFYNDYDRLRSQVPSGPIMDSGVLVMTMSSANQIAGHTYGAELLIETRPMDDWRLQASYSNLQMHLRDKSGIDANSSALIEGSSPQHQVSIRSEFNINKDVQLDIWAKYVGALPALNIGAYTALNTRLAWRPHKQVELSLVGKNLLKRQHSEYRPEYLGTVATDVQRSIYAGLRVYF